MRLVSLFLVCSFGLAGCGSGPKVTTCVSDPDLIITKQVREALKGLVDDAIIAKTTVGGNQCVTPDNKVQFMPYNETGNYVCFSPSDARTLLESCSVKGSDLVSAINDDRALKDAIASNARTFSLYYQMKNDSMVSAP